MNHNRFPMASHNAETYMVLYILVHNLPFQLQLHVMMHCCYYLLKQLPDPHGLVLIKLVLLDIML